MAGDLCQIGIFIAAMTTVWRFVNATSTDDAPWYVVPADDKHNARLIVSQIVLDAFHSLKIAYPTTSEERRSELKAIRKKLQKGHEEPR